MVNIFDNSETNMEKVIVWDIDTAPICVNYDSKSDYSYHYDAYFY